MHTRYPRLILASASPRRRELLEKMGLDFTVFAADVDENIPERPRDAVKILAHRKAEAVRANFESGLIIAADTLVSLEDTALGKPRDRDDAKRMLCSLSGKRHEVVTGVCLMDASDGRYLLESVSSSVSFRSLTEEEIEAYIDTGEPMDKAGAYAIQGIGKRLVAGYEGSYDNIVGFPTEEFKRMLSAFSND